MKKILFIFAAAAITFSARAAETTLATFEANGVPTYAIENGVLDTLRIAAKNPDTAAVKINASDTSLYGHTINTLGSLRGGIKIIPKAAGIDSANHYLHVMIYTNLQKYELDLFTSDTANGTATARPEARMGIDSVATPEKWFDHVVNLKDLKGAILDSFCISTLTSNPANLNKDLYVDEIVLNGDSTPRVPTVASISLNNNTSVVKGDTMPFSASVSVKWGAPSGVTWSVTGGTSQATTIDAGVLIVATNETAAKLTVTATSVFDGTKSATVTVLIGKLVDASALASFESSSSDVFDIFNINGTWTQLEVVANPSKTTDLNTTDSCLLNTRAGGESWTNGGHFCSSLGDFVQGDSGRYLHIMVYSPVATSGLVFVRRTNIDDQWANDAADFRFDFRAGEWKDVVLDLRNISTMYGFYFLSQDWGGAPAEGRTFYYDEIVVNTDPTPRGESLITASGVVSDFEEGGATLDYLIEGNALTTLSVVDNPDKTGINATSKALYGRSSTSGESWGGAKIVLGNVLINENTRYLHVLMKTNVPHYEFDFFPMSGQGGEKYAGKDSTTNLTTWFDHVVDLYDVAGEKNFEGCVLTAFRVVIDVKKEENWEKDLYLDEILFSSDPTPRAPSVTINSVTPANPSVAKGATLQLTADVTATGGANPAVTWSVSGGVNMTGITAAGLLSVAASETAATLTVTVTSVYDPTKSVSVTVTVTATSTAVEKTAGVATLSAYPNPTTGTVYVENEGNSEVLVYSVSGELLLRATGAAIDLSALPTGVYVIKAGEKTAKVVKK
jgi:hypothetical protein